MGAERSEIAGQRSMEQNIENQRLYETGALSTPQKRRLVDIQIRQACASVEGEAASTLPVTRGT